MYANMDEVRKANREAGRHWFEPDTMRFFSSVIESEIIGGEYFISSEKPPHGKRAFTVRRVDEHGHVGTAGALLEFASLELAEAAANELAGA